VLTAGNLTLATADATGALTLRSTGGALRATGAVNGGPIQLAAGGAVQMDAHVIAAGTLAVDAGGAFTLGGQARGSAITVLSNDIVLGSTAALGRAWTTLDVTLTNRTAQRTTFVGGARTRAATASTRPKRHASSPTARSRSTRPAMSLFAASRSATATPGSSARAASSRSRPRRACRSPAAVNLTTSSATDTFTIDPTRIELDTGTGSIALLGASGAPLGRLALVGNTIAAGTATTLTQLATTTDFAAINALLDRPGRTAAAAARGTVSFTWSTRCSSRTAERPRSSATAPVHRGRRRDHHGAAVDADRDQRPGLTPTGPLLGLDTQTGVTINGTPAAAGGRFDPARRSTAA
jgi:hypothetical protein